MSYKKTLAQYIGKTPIWRMGELIRSKRPRILFYHGVYNQPYCDPLVQANQMQLTDFKEQILFLKKKFQIISIEDFYSMFKEKYKFSGKEIVLTFDDGYKNNLHVAAPFLFENKIPFTVFISTDYIENESFVPTYYIRSAILSSNIEKIDVSFLRKSYILHNRFDRITAMTDVIDVIKKQEQPIVNQVILEIEEQIGQERREEINTRFASERILSWKEVKTLHDAGVTIGSHTATHCVLHERQDTYTLRNELSKSKLEIINNIGECKFFAFPNGGINSICRASLVEAGKLYEMSFGVNGKSVSSNDSLNFISRIGVAPTLNMLKIQLSLIS